VALPRRRDRGRLSRAQPDVLVAYPLVLHALGFEARPGRVRIAPRHVLTCAEPLLPEIRAAAWDVRVGNLWGAASAPPAIADART
jgi:hypothetical protein